MGDPRRDAPDALWFRYTFTFRDGARKSLRAELDFRTLALRAPPLASYPEWTRLSFHQCPNCPLKESEHPRCPVAAGLVDVVEAFKDSVSYEEVDVEVETRDRTYRKRAPLQAAISPLVGIHMVTSGCPILDRLRPMVDTHLPFMSPAETTYRTLSMYLLAQYFRQRAGKAPDWEMKGLVDFLAEVRRVNGAFCRRLAAIRIKDASLNAVALLNTLGDFTSFTLEIDDLARLEGLFRVHSS